MGQNYGRIRFRMVLAYSWMLSFPSDIFDSSSGKVSTMLSHWLFFILLQKWKLGLGICGGELKYPFFCLSSRHYNASDKAILLWEDRRDLSFVDQSLNRKF